MDILHFVLSDFNTSYVWHPCMKSKFKSFISCYTNWSHCLICEMILRRKNKIRSLFYGFILHVLKSCINRK